MHVHNQYPQKYNRPLDSYIQAARVKQKEEKGKKSKKEIKRVRN